MRHQHNMNRGINSSTWDVIYKYREHLKWDLNLSPRGHCWEQEEGEQDNELGLHALLYKRAVKNRAKSD